MGDFNNLMQTVAMHIHREKLVCQNNCGYFAYYLQFDHAKENPEHKDWKVYLCDTENCDGIMIPALEEENE